MSANVFAGDAVRGPIRGPGPHVDSSRRQRRDVERRLAALQPGERSEPCCCCPGAQRSDPAVPGGVSSATSSRNTVICGHGVCPARWMPFPTVWEMAA